MGNKYTHKHLVRINYVSGNSIEAWFYQFDIDFSSNRKATWVVAGPTVPLFINVSEIESIWCIDSVELAECEGPEIE